MLKVKFKGLNFKMLILKAIIVSKRLRLQFKERVEWYLEFVGKKR